MITSKPLQYYYTNPFDVLQCTGRETTSAILASGSILLRKHIFVKPLILGSSIKLTLQTMEKNHLQSHARRKEKEINQFRFAKLWTRLKQARSIQLLRCFPSKKLFLPANVKSESFFISIFISKTALNLFNIVDPFRQNVKLSTGLSQRNPFGILSTPSQIRINLLEVISVLNRDGISYF